VRLFDRWLAFPLQPGDLAHRLPLGVTARVGLDLLAAPLRAGRAAQLRRALLLPTDQAPRPSAQAPRPFDLGPQLPDGQRDGRPPHRQRDGRPPDRHDGSADAWSPGRPSGAERATFAAVARAKVGPTVTDAFYLPYAAKVWGVPASELAGELARRRVGTDRPSALLRRVLAGRRLANRTFLYPRHGFGQLTAALAGAATRSGARLVPGATVSAIDVPAARGLPVRVGIAGGQSVSATTVFSTLPVGALAALRHPTLPGPVDAALRRLEQRAMVLVYLVLDQDRYTPFDAHYLPGASTPLTRLSEPKNYRDGPDPVGRTVLCAELPAWVGDPVWERDDEDLARLVVRTVCDLDLPTLRPVGHRVLRCPGVYPVLRAGHEDAWATVCHELRRAAADDGVVSFGRQGLHTHDNTHHALAMAWEAVDCLDTAGRFDGPRWQAALERFADHVVED
jgi:protoporphyrinogen oxidase